MRINKNRRANQLVVSLTKIMLISSKRWDSQKLLQKKLSLWCFMLLVEEVLIKHLNGLTSILMMLTSMKNLKLLDNLKVLEQKVI